MLLKQRAVVQEVPTWQDRITGHRQLFGECCPIKNMWVIQLILKPILNPTSWRKDLKTILRIFSFLKILTKRLLTVRLLNLCKSISQEESVLISKAKWTSMPDTFSAENAAVDCIFTEEKLSNRKIITFNVAVFKGEQPIVPHTISEKMCLTKSSCTIWKRWQLLQENNRKNFMRWQRRTAKRRQRDSTKPQSEKNANWKAYQWAW